MNPQIKITGSGITIDGWPVRLTDGGHRFLFGFLCAASTRPEPPLLSEAMTEAVESMVGCHGEYITPDV